jgi:hypothetical protein
LRDGDITTRALLKLLLGLLTILLVVQILSFSGDAQPREAASSPNLAIVFIQEVAVGSLVAAAIGETFIRIGMGNIPYLAYTDPFTLLTLWIGGNSLGAVLGVTGIASLYHMKGNLPRALLGSVLTQVVWLVIEQIYEYIYIWGYGKTDGTVLLHWGLPISAGLGAAVGFNFPLPGITLGAQKDGGESSDGTEASLELSVQLASF